MSAYFETNTRHGSSITGPPSAVTYLELYSIFSFIIILKKSLYGQKKIAVVERFQTRVNAGVWIFCQPGRKKKVAFVERWAFAEVLMF